MNFEYNDIISIFPELQVIFGTLKTNDEKKAGKNNLIALVSLLFTGEYNKAFDVLLRSLQLYENQEEFHSDKALYEQEMFSYILLFYYYYETDHSEASEESLEEAIQLHEEMNYQCPCLYFWLVYFRALIEYKGKKYENAIQFIEEALTICKKPEGIYEPLSLQIKGKCFIELGKYKNGLELLNTARTKFKRTNNLFLLSIYIDIGNMETKTGQYELAEQSFKWVISHPRKLAPVATLTAYYGLAWLYMIQGMYLLAEKILLQTLGLAKKYRMFSVEVKCLEGLGSIHINLKSYIQAKKYLSQVLNLTAEVPIDKANALLEYGRLALLLKNVEMAKSQGLYFRGMVQTKDLSNTLVLFKINILMLEGQFEKARLELEKIQLRSALKEVFQLRIQITLAKLVLMELEATKTTNQQDIAEIEESEEFIEEFVDRIKIIKPYLETRITPGIALCFTLLDVSILCLQVRSSELDKQREFVLKKLERSKLFALQYNLSRIKQIVILFQRRFKRRRIHLKTIYIIEILNNLEQLILGLPSVKLDK